MKIETSWGKIIATATEIVIRLNGPGMITLQAHTDCVQLIGRGANVISSNAGDCKWSVKLDTEEELLLISEVTGIAAE